MGDNYTNKVLDITARRDIKFLPGGCCIGKATFQSFLKWNDPPFC